MTTTTRQDEQTGAEAQYFCRTCQRTFPAEQLRFRVEHFHDDAWGQNAWFHNRVELCPCGSEDIEPVHICIECGEVPSAEGTDRCETCIAEEEAEWDARVALAKASPPKLSTLASLRAAIADIILGAA